MGLASSQARLLNLTSRMHQIEYKAAKLENEKLQMANASRRAYLEYQEATEKTKIQIKVLQTNAAATYVDITSYGQMVESGFAFCVHGVPVEKGSVKPGFIAIGTGESTKYYAESDCKKTENNGTTTYTPNDGAKVYTEEEVKYQADVADIVCTDVKQLQEALTTKYQASLGTNSVDIENLSVQEFRAALSNIITLGDVTIVQEKVEQGTNYGFLDPSDPEFDKWESSVATNTSFQEVEDETNLRKAEAKYEADMRRIDMKDRKFDYDLQALDAERNAIKQEMETLKTVAKDNVERTFKLFS